MTMTAIPAPARRKSFLQAFKRSPIAGLISLRYFILRFSTAGSALIAGLIQTFVFARVLDPELFSIFILVGTLGISMWLFDLGLPKILFVELRARHLAGDDKDPAARQANALALLYAALVAAGALLCFAAMAARPSATTWQAAEFALFFLFSALNLVWFVLRNFCIAVDEFIYFETLEALRRAGHIALMLAMLIGLPFALFLLAVNALWAVLFALAVKKLIERGALTRHLRGVFSRLAVFFRANRKAALRTGTHAASELYIHNVMYLAVPVVFGLGAPTIVLDTTFKVFFGTLVLYSAACDLLVPRQTSAYAARDARTLLRATVMAMLLCAAPAVAIGALLVLAADDLFALLLGPAATMPATVTPILLVLLAAGVAKTAANYLLQHTGFFREIARLAFWIAAGTTAAVATGIIAGLDLIQLLAIYAGSYACGALFYLALAIHKPIRLARQERETVTAC